MSEKNVPTDEMTSDELMALGKRNMACHDVQNAVVCYARACSKIAKEHGPLSSELAEPSYLYGKALLEIARLEASVLCGTLPEEEEESSSSDEEADQSGIASSSNIEGNNQKESSSHDQEECSSHNPAENSIDQSNDLQDQAEGSHDHSEGSHDREEGSRDQKEDAHNQEEASHDQEQSSHHDQGEGSLNQGEGSGDQGEASGDQGEESHSQEESQEITGLQLAWEALELSRVIFSKEDTKEAKLRVTDVMATLGEIGLESDMYEQAIKDFTAGLEIRESILPNHDRRIAELQFQLGLAYTLVKDFDNAIQAYQKAKNTLKGTIEHLHSLITDSNATVTETESYQKELKELEELLPDLDSKIEDVVDAKKQMLHSVMSCMQDEAGSSSSFGACSSASVSKAPATDISHLVRKRPVAKDSAQPDSDPKRSKKADTSSVDVTTASEQ